MKPDDLKTNLSNSKRPHRIPIYILEEHNEAFPVWIKTINNFDLSKRGHTLLHFDDHSDMTTLRVNTPMRSVFDWSYNQLETFARDELTIASFIKAASFVGIFKNVVWCKVDAGREVSSKYFITSYNNDYKNLLSGTETKNNPLLEFDHEVVSYTKLGVKHLENKKYGDVLLDIDLDYFSCNIQPENNKEIIIEVTQEEYNNFKSDPYHPIRFISNTVMTRSVEDSYFLIINYYKDVFPSPRRVSETLIKDRIDTFINTLKSLNINPLLITVCRSVKSGYTPKDQWKFIEKEVLLGLNKLYNLKDPVSMA
ncbi:peptide arginase, FlmR/OhkR family [Cochleicola gelatinilyticus]|uniref:Uncharacterized protein n=1 Tax=Cochleicola gelatinilyticus TaxID=1763537 RepID=A0A167IPQ4_9FLAO|nr:UPF0489 family protein [Cochleicola gelatinilyticus]OAB79889.1 hypothetical protein ULVI_03880 [Cochleicola gelatinilyticus]